ncbi:Hypothetical predicted protein [Podarcis lilfordi]|uniref:Snake toxin/toxin-like domain-containing protein n=1 Tax=Podarcis lilfordi TaxID=74358 RepID=A0AA35P7X1_9SAUR|nr:Hypothetical predicted protein [Podarcis lilfordi]
MMKVLPVLLLTTILWTKTASSLECYTCNETKYSGCDTVVNCSQTDRFCTRYTETTSSTGYAVEQRCSNTCLIAKVSWPSLFTFTCCQEDRCNGTANVRFGMLMLVVLVVIRALI